MGKVIKVLTYLLVVGAIVFFADKLKWKEEDTTYEAHRSGAIFAECMATYNESGMSGLIELSKQSYEKFDSDPTLENLRHAALIDLFSLKIDTSVSDSIGFPREIYFGKETFAGRMMPRLSSPENKNRPYLRIWIREAREEIEIRSNTP